MSDVLAQIATSAGTFATMAGLGFGAWKLHIAHKAKLEEKRLDLEAARELRKEDRDNTGQIRLERHLEDRIADLEAERAECKQDLKETVDQLMALAGRVAVVEEKQSEYPPPGTDDRDTTPGRPPVPRPGKVPR